MQIICLVNTQKNTSIAIQLNLSKSTIETHRKNIRKKLKLTGYDNLLVLATLYSVQYNSDNEDDILLPIR